MLKRKQLWASCRNSIYLLLALFLLTAASLVGTNLLTYHRLTHESPIASLQIEQIKQQQYRINFISQDTCKKTSYLVSPEKHIIYLKCKELSLFLSDQIDQKCY
ncbi:MAG: hypothetical protein KZQ57_05005, partial [gamma proteobacterium symbiont of Lucinoma myriamae]|nr:hypothetical protein [gamma proteobacterium symbiont of Lucinoma myriamae]